MPRAILVATFALVVVAAAAGAAPRSQAAAPLPGVRVPGPASLDAAAAAELFGVPPADIAIRRDEGPPPVWEVTRGGRLLGIVGSTWEITGSIGYSGKPIDILVAVSPEARIAGAKLVRQSEPVLTLGISPEDIAAYVARFRGIDLTRPHLTAFDAESDLPPVIARATVSSGVIRDAILRTARTLALSRGLVGGAGSRVDRTRFEERSWQALAAEGALANVTVTLDEARAALAGAKVPPPPGDKPFLDLWVALLDPPTIGRNLLGLHTYNAIIAKLGAGDSALLIASRGLHSHRGTEWRRSGLFDRLELIQGERRLRFRAADFTRIDKLAAADAPEFKEISVFRIAAETGFDPTLPFRLEVIARRPTADGGEVEMRIGVDYVLPRRYVAAPPTEALPEAVPLWQSAWEAKRGRVFGVGLMLAVLFGILLFQEPFARRKRLWRIVRLGYLSVTLVWLGWIAGGQLSVVQVAAFLHALLEGFRWETFLIEPVIFVLWSFTALAMLFWGRGVYCGWLCPFGALQELLNEAAQWLGVRQLAIPFVVHERLWMIKYTLFLAIIGLSFYSMREALILAEVEPFKTAVSLRFAREWPFVAFVLALLVAGLFVERFYCRFLCPLGAGLAIPAKLRIFDWLNRRPQCGRECRLCETKCTVGAIDPLGRINPNECVLCLRCQVIYHDSETCVVLKRRAAARPATGSGARPAPAPTASAVPVSRPGGATP